MTGPRFDFSINLGHVLTIGGVVITMVMGWTNFDARLTRAEEVLRTQTATLIEQVRQGSRLDAIEDRLERLERP